MPIVKSDEQFPERSIVVMLVGTPFSRKTSLANTAKNPVLIDADRGADRSWGRPDTFVLKEGWGELLKEDRAGTFNSYGTIIHDTSKAILDDFLTEYVIGINYKLKTNKMQMYGAIGDEYKQYVNKHRAANQDIIIISHDKTKDEDGVNVIMPDITGGSKNLLLRICDQVGYVSNKRVQKDGKWVDIVTVDFTPTQMTPFCKNVAGLPEIELPHYTNPEWKTFMDVHIMQPTKDAISKITEEQREALRFIEEWRVSIDAIAAEPGKDEETNKVLNETLTEIANITPEHIKVQIRAYFSAHLNKMGWGWVKEPAPGAFRPKAVTAPVVEKPAAPVAPPVEENKTPPAETAPPVVEEDKPPITTPDPSTPVINRNPNMAKPDPNDLFAKPQAN